MNRTDELIRALRATGYRITPQRIEICRALAESKIHPSPQIIYRQVSEKYPGISQATVYNTLTVLRDLGEIVEVGLGQDRTHYEPDPSPHVNLICLRCGTIEDLENQAVATLSAQLAKAQGLRMKAARMDIYGFCRTCQTLPSLDRSMSKCEEANES
jgi:Fur family transcriptional regulator, peroxide stress response regulator